MTSEPTSTLPLGIIFVIFAGLAFDMRAWFMANLPSNN